MNCKPFPRQPLAQACAAGVIALGVATLAPSVLAATAAGTQIKNLATVTYEDATGNVYTAQSNEAIVTVSQVYAATLGVDVDVSAAAGQTVYLPYVLTNTGNGSDVYAVSAANATFGGDNIDSGSIIVYQDTNGSGEPDAGENPVSSVTLLAGDTMNLVVAVQVPANATAAQKLGITLTATAQGDGNAATQVVTDLTAGKGKDGIDSTNQSIITVTDNAALVTTKTSSHDVANKQISYTIQVRNNGNQPAKDVVIYDGLPANTTLVSSSVSGILSTNGDTTNQQGVLSETTLGRDLNGDGDVTDPGEANTGIDLNGNGSATDTGEAALGLDLNNDGDLADTNVSGVYAIDAELPPNTNVTLTFTVSYDPATLGGGTVIRNQGHVVADTDSTPGADTLVSSNTVQDAISAAFAVDITDTKNNPSPGINDGGDDDNTDNDDQRVDQAAAGSSVLFTNVITNNGNADDIFELQATPGTFPTGTVFTFHRSTPAGLLPLGDTNSAGGIDTGVVAAGGTTTIVVRAILPSSASGPGPAPANAYVATVTATSANDPAPTPASNTVSISLATIITAVVDLHNAKNGAAGDQDALGTAPYSAVTTFTGSTGNTVNIPLYIDNESGSSDSFVLNAGSTYNGTTLTGLQPGWSVEFFAGDGNGVPVNPAISTTAPLPGGSFNYEVIAVVTIPGDSSLAVDDLSFNNDGIAGDEKLDGNNDLDGDYPIFFQITSQNTGATDIKLDAIDVESTRQLSLVTPGSNQVEAGGSVDFGHTLSNSGNVSETVEITSSNNQTGWTHAVAIDTNGDGTPDTNLGSLVAGQITVQQPDGTDVVVTVADVDADGNPELTLQPGFSLPLTATVFAPSNAAPPQVDTLTIQATNMETVAGAPSVSVTDQITVINGQVRISKSVAIDANCDGTPETPFAAVQTTGVAPNQCAIWQVIAENQGASNASNVTITDVVTAFSTYEAGSLRYCLTNACVPAAVTDAADTDAGTLTGNNIVFYVGNTPNPGAGQGGVLIPGEKATAQFRVRVQ